MEVSYAMEAGTPMDSESINTTLLARHSALSLEPESQSQAPLGPHLASGSAASSCVTLPLQLPLGQRVEGVMGREAARLLKPDLLVVLHELQRQHWWQLALRVRDTRTRRPTGLTDSGRVAHLQ